MARQSWLQHCLLNRMTLFALSLSLSLCLSLTPPPPPPPPPVRARSPSSSLHACWQHKLHSSAVFPHCRSRSCMSSAYLSGMGLLKGNATSRVSVCAHPQSILLLSSLSSSAPPPPPNPPTPKTPLRIISVKDSSQERPPPHTHNSPSPFNSFSHYSKSCFEIWVCSNLSEEQYAPQRGHLHWCDLELVRLFLKSNLLRKCPEGFLLLCFEERS